MNIVIGPRIHEISERDFNLNLVKVAVLSHGHISLVIRKGVKRLRKVLLSVKCFMITNFKWNSKTRA
uniref:Uncharacterized protein n=1 Tax=Octopus bimaculoides TaxID=37653 RepID=A0A0L8HV08_OCTBM